MVALYLLMLQQAVLMIRGGKNTGLNILKFFVAYLDPGVVKIWIRDGNLISYLIFLGV
jgi:hypothetical protein